jgi:dTDP-4-dehydrorhamnose 3,5-epimerase
LTGVVIPPGVAHGFYYVRPSIDVCGVSQYFSQDDELGCRWNAPDLGLEWPCKDPVLSEKDGKAMSYAELREALDAARK